MVMRLLLIALLSAGTLAGTLDRRQLSRCNRFCTEQYDPVCGSDGKTYPNQCFFDASACKVEEQGGKPPRVVSRGHCQGAHTQTHVDDDACNQVCDEEKQPICASDGQVYNNPCLFKRAACEAAKNNIQLSIVVYAGSCPSPTHPDCEQYKVDVSDLALEGGMTFTPSCPSTRRPVCASDGHTYSNECQLCHHIDVSGVNLTISNSDACHSSSVHTGSGAGTLQDLLESILAG